MSTNDSCIIDFCSSSIHHECCWLVLA